MTRRIVTARTQVEMLSPWRTAANEGIPITDTGLPHTESNGRWDYRYSPGDQRDEYHEWRIHPTSAPATMSGNFFGKERTVHYDPSLTSISRDETGFVPSYRGNHLEDLNPPQGMLWRGMSKEEYEEAQRHGYFQSRGDANMGDSQVGKTYFSTGADHAGSYASSFSHTETEPTFTHPGYVVGIPDRPELPREGGHEVGVPGRIPFDSATHHYRVRPVSIEPGYQGMYKNQVHGWGTAGSSTPRVNYHWDQHQPLNHTASKRTAERAVKFEWQRSFDGGGGWELVVRNPDGNPVRVKTEPARGQRSAKRSNHDR